jgi:hypothetical protein
MHMTIDSIRDGLQPRITALPGRVNPSEEAHSTPCQPAFERPEPGILSTAELRRLVLEIMG